MFKDHKHNIIFSIYIIVILVTASFFPSLYNDFTNWDDNYYVVNNSDIKSLSLENLKKIFSSIYIGNYQPITILSYAIEYNISPFGLIPTIYHATNLLFHNLNSLVVFYIFYLLCGNIFISLIVAILFGIHPMHVESVAWVSGRKDVLSSFFFLGALAAFILYDKKKSSKHYIISIILYVLSLLSKPMGIILPFILHLIDYYNGKKIDKNSMKAKIPFWIISIIFVFVTFATQHKADAFRLAPKLSFIDNFFIASHGIVFYIIKLLVPINLSCFYPYPEKINNLFPIQFIISPIIVLCLAIAVIISERYTKKILFGALFFLITIFPVLQLIPVGGAIAADRYSYIPFIGFFYIIAEGINKIYITEFNNHRKIKFILSTFFILFLIFFGYLTFERCKVWKNSITLWSDVISKYPNVAGAYNNRGLAYSNDEMEFKKAIVDFTINLKLKPDSPQTYNNRGYAYFALGEDDKAISDFTDALKLEPNFAEAYFNRATVYFRKKMHVEAIADYSKAIDIVPNYIRAYKIRGQINFYIGKYNEALDDLSKAIQLDPKYYEAYIFRAQTYLKLNNREEGFKDIRFLINAKYPVGKNLLEKFQK